MSLSYGQHRRPPAGHFHHLIAAGRPLPSSLAPVKSKTFDIPAPADPVVVELWPLMRLVLILTKHDNDRMHEMSERVTLACGSRPMSVNASCHCGSPT